MITILFYFFILLISLLILNSNIDDGIKMIFEIVFIIESWGFTIMLINNLG